MRYFYLAIVLCVVGCATSDKEERPESNLGTWDDERRFGGLEIEITEAVPIVRGEDWCVPCDNTLTTDRGEKKETDWFVCFDPITGPKEDPEKTDRLKGTLTMTSEMAAANTINPVFMTEKEINVEVSFKYDDPKVKTKGLPNPQSTVQCLKDYKKLLIEVNDLELRR